MTKTLCTFLIALPLLLTTACISTATADKYALDDCKSLNAIFKTQDTDSSTNFPSLETGATGETSKDKATWPWGRGGTNADKLSKERAALRKAHRRKGCTP